MRRIRRADLAPRVEMVPLIDVIFLLLTFFIYSMITMIHANVLPVKLTAVRTGKHAQAGRFDAITIDRAGKLYWNRKPISSKDLATRLDKLGQQKHPPRIFLAMQKDAEAASEPSKRQTPAVDRGPLLMNLVQRLREAGIKDFSLVGEPHGS